MNFPSPSHESTTAGDAGSPCRVLIVDDHQLFRNGLAELINSDPGVTVVGEAADAPQAVEKFSQLRPHLVTLDISLAKGNALELIHTFKEIDPSVAVLVISMFDEGTYADPAIKAGATGYICKQASNEQIMEAVRTVRGQGIYLSQPAMNRMLQRTVNSHNGGDVAPESQLSTRELQIFTLIGQGETTQKIAKQLFLAPSTVETYRERIKNKLSLASGAELTRKAILWTLHNS